MDSSDTDIQQFLHEKGEDLYYACRQGDLTRAKEQLKYGADVNYKSNKGTPLQIAVIRGEKRIIDLLIEAGANLNDRNSDKAMSDEVTALMIASHNGYKGIAQLLIKSGANINEKSLHGKTAFDFAVRNGNKDIANMLRTAEEKYKTDLGVLRMEEKMDFEDFVRDAIVSLRKEGYKGIHTVYSGFDVAFKKYYKGIEPDEVLKNLSREGKIVMRSVEGDIGFMLYLPEDAPVLKEIGDEALDKILKKKDNLEQKGHLEQMRELNQMHNEGLIGDSEYEVKKKEILSRI